MFRNYIQKTDCISIMDAYRVRHTQILGIDLSSNSIVYKTHFKKSLHFTCFKDKCFYLNRVNAFENTIFSCFRFLILIYK